MKQKQQKHESNDHIYWTIIIVFFMLAIGTFFHEAILHGLVAWAYGWKISDIQTGLMTGSTSVLAAKNASWQAYWIFFMFPSLAIFLLVVIATIIKPERSIMVAGIILMSLNLPSLNPAIFGSDSYNAVDMLVKRGFAEGYVSLMHYLLFFVVLLVWGVYLYITIESSESDARARIINVYQ